MKKKGEQRLEKLHLLVKLKLEPITLMDDLKRMIRERCFLQDFIHLNHIIPDNSCAEVKCNYTFENNINQIQKPLCKLTFNSQNISLEHIYTVIK